MGIYNFVYEEPRYKRAFAIIGTVFILALIVIVVLTNRTNLSEFVHSSPVVEKSVGFFQQDIIKLNTRGIFYVTFLGDLFFNPLPAEIFFYDAIIKGNSPILFLFIAAIIGAFLSHLINYILGRKFSIFFMYFVSKKSLYKVRAKVNRYGAYAVLFCNILPLPSPLLTFGLGVTRYNSSRLFIMLMIGNIIKYGFLALTYIYFT